MIGKGPIALLDAGRTLEFEREERELEIPRGARRCGVDVIVRRPGTVWIDELSCVLEGHAPRVLGPLELENGSFDADLAGWRGLTAAGSGVELVRDKRVRSKGAASLRLERASPRLFPEGGAWSSVTDLARAKRLALAFAVRVDGAARAAVALQAMDARGVALATERTEIGPTEERFVERELALALPKEAKRVDVYLLVKGTGTVWFDALEVGKR